LRSTGYYEAVATVSTERRATDGRELVTIAVEAGAKVELRFAGDPLPSAVGHPDELVPAQREGAADDDLLESARVRIETRLRSAGYREGRATYTRAPLPDGAIGITFTISRGPRYRIDRVDIPARP
jgi:outer membrane protein assembly factor BamA